jgi:glycosyltransferase involved in cell wall biosynthesis
MILHAPPKESSLSGEHISALEGAEALARYGYDVDWLDWNANGRPLRQQEVEEQIRRRNADVVVIDKWFPKGTLIRKLPVASVYRVHNFMPICIAGTFSRDNRLCTDCSKGSGLPGIRYQCYRSGAAWSIAATTVHQFQRRAGLLSHADRVVFPGHRAMALFEQAIPNIRSRAVIVPSYVPDLEPPTTAMARNDFFLFAGQLEEYKGIRGLLEVWPSNLRLRIAGSGSLINLVQHHALKDNIEYLGVLSPHDVRRQMAEAAALVFLSSTPETFGRVHAEACSVGTPTIALKGSTVADEVTTAGSGLVVDNVQELVIAAQSAALPSAVHVRSVFEHRYTERIWAPSMARVIEDARRAHLRARGGKL